MKPIRQLDRTLINKIAAGEVVERPLSVVKELTENAIDAGASVITVEIRDGGLTQIRVTDNGIGIPATDLSLAFAQHATSKIETAEDLYEILTLGFRGEALSSIAAVSQVEMITKTAEAVTGTRIEVHGGKEIVRQEIGCANGTTLVVSNLFYNVPARRKFIKKPATEAGYISDIMQKLALGNPGIAFRYINNGQLILQTYGYNDVKSAIHSVYGREVSSKLAEVCAEEALVSLSGYVGKPEIARSSRSHGIFFVNGRYIKSRLLGQAVESGMKTLLFSGKFPLYVLYLTLPPHVVDVNVHPNKTEVRFAHEENVFDFITKAVSRGLAEQNLIPEVAFVRKKAKEAPDDFDVIALPSESDAAQAQEKKIFLSPRSVEDNPLDEVPSVAVTMPSVGASEALSAALALPQAADSLPAPSAVDGRLIFREDRGAVSPPVKPFFHNYTLLGLLFKTYWLVSQENSLFLIDQHAAHERVLFEDIKEKAQIGPIHAQPLLEPIALRLTLHEAQSLRDNAELFEKFGFEIIDNGGVSIGIASVPFILKGPVSPGLFTDILDKLENPGAASENLFEYKINSLAMSACRAAVKANDALDEKEARALIVRMLSLRNPFTCPHGRPTIIEITQRELERKFKRVT